MNGLKNLNDSFGHLEGDKALVTLAEIFESSIEPATMCAYHVSGDEFIILMFQGKISELDKTVDRIRTKMRDSEYSAAIGCCFIDKKEGNITYEEAYKKAEELMYADKSHYYSNGGPDWRKKHS